jgi:histidine triad (HIT) family protein
MSDCVFCKIVAGEIPAIKVYENDETLAFMDLGQVNPGHVIVIVKPHVQDVYGLNSDLAAAVFRTATHVAQGVKKAMKPEGMTLLQTNEQAGWQTVRHFHIHVLPRHQADGLTLTWPAKNPPQEVLEEYASQIKAQLKGFGHF